MLKKSRIIAVLSVCVMMFAVVQPAYAVPQTYYRCRKCGKVADSEFGKLTAGSCSGFVHDWVTETVDSNESKYQKQMEETRQKAAGEAWFYGHTQGCW